MGKGGIQHILAMTVGVQPGVEGGKAIPLSPCDVFPAGAVADPLGVQPVRKGAAIETVMLEIVLIPHILAVESGSRGGGLAPFQGLQAVNGTVGVDQMEIQPAFGGPLHVAFS